MNDAQDGNLFPLRHKHKSVSLTKREIAILRLADAYGISNQAAVKLILRLRAKKKAAATQKSKDSTAN